ncbi:DUF4870 family protein [Planctobacterium marinum]|uniref:DUF4870 family protein n=1 Tax=Planctobacterium marinum TaxID=1631968 RepID=UPI001E4E1583|nr:hypothetical protein [Planctobacterium marinum]MCC2603787.1 hypothetical protein [Planctobacterium marinum]
MSDNQESSSETQSLSLKDDAAKTSALVAYGLMVVGLFTGIFWIVGAVWAMVKKEEAQGSLFEDHYANIIKTFWWGLGISIVGFLLMVIIIGHFILMAVWIWSIYRIVKGLARLTSNKAYHS